MNPEECEHQLIEFVGKLDPVLNPLGFVFQIDGHAVSSGGPFASGFYVNEGKKIGLIYRSFSGLGSVNYECHNFAVSHTDLMHYLIKDGESKLKYNAEKFSSYSKDDGNVIDALIYDIQNFEIELLTSSTEQFSGTLRKIVKSHTTSHDSKVLDGVIIGIVIGGVIGWVVNSLGWGVLVGFILGLVGGIYIDLQRGRQKANRL